MNAIRASGTTHPKQIHVIITLALAGCLGNQTLTAFPSYAPDIWWWQRGEICALTEWQAWAQRHGVDQAWDDQTKATAFAIYPNDSRLIRIHAHSQGLHLVDAFTYSADHGAYAMCGAPSYFYHWIRTHPNVQNPGPNWSRAPEPVAWVHYSTACTPTPWDDWASRERQETAWVQDEQDPARAKLLQQYFEAHGHSTLWTYSSSYRRGLGYCKEIVAPQDALNLRSLGMLPLPPNLAQ